MSHTIKPGVATGDEVKAIFDCPTNYFSFLLPKLLTKQDFGYYYDSMNKLHKLIIQQCHQLIQQ